MATTADRLKQIMDERNLKQVDILRLAKPYCERYNVKLSKSHLSQYVSGVVEPSQYKLTILGLALNVSEVWLMGHDAPRERQQPAGQLTDGLDEELVRRLLLLTPEELAVVDAFVQGILAAH